MVFIIKNMFIDVGISQVDNVEDIIFNILNGAFRYR